MLVQSLLAAAFAVGSSAQMMNLTAALASSPDLSNLTTYVQAVPGLLEMLAGASNVTILAPSNMAFEKLLAGPVGAMLAQNNSESNAALAAILNYHVLNGTYPSSAIMDMPAFVPTMLNESMFANVTGGQVVEVVKQDDSVKIYSGLLANSTVTTPDVNFSGGVVHIIDQVLTLPVNISTTAQEAGLSAVVGALKAADLVEAVDTAMDLTVFAPNNDAFQNIGSATANLSMEALASILEYHVVNGTVGYSSMLMNGTSLMTMNGGNLTIRIEDGDVFVNSAKVVTPNVLVGNGVVHVIDNVLNPNNTSVAPDPAQSTQAVAYDGASRASDNPLTSGVPAPTSSIGMGPSMASEASGSATAASTSGAAVPMRTGSIGAAALMAGAGVWLNM